jgi:hypothetical protein
MRAVESVQVIPRNDQNPQAEGCGKTLNESFRRAVFARGICFFLGLAKKSRSLASLGMTKEAFFRSL